MTTSPLTPQRFTRKPETVEAVHVTEENMAEVAAWCGGDLAEELPSGWPVILLDEDGGVAPLNGWVTRTDDGFFEGQEPGWDHGYQPALPSTAQVTEYRLSLLPEDDDGEYRLWSLSVCRLPGAGDRWYVLWSAERVLTASGGWERRGYWENWWPLAEALRRAGAALPSLKVNGKSAADVVAERGEAKP